MAATTLELRFGTARLDVERRQLLIDGQPAKLGARAFDVLLALVERRDRAVNKNELFELVWPGVVVEENNLRVHISALRKLLGPAVIATIPGRGYRFTAALDADADNANQTADSTSRGVPHNLPQQRTHFIGREAAQIECERLLRQVPLLTLTGVGGCGKTRLAMQLARRQLTAFRDGVWFVDLAPLQEPQRVAYAVASALGVREETGTTLVQRVTDHLASRQLLVVLDNCEHVIDAAAQLADALLAACAELKIVATSREGLGVVGEQIFPVRPLSLPIGADRDAVLGSEAARLFIDRASLALPDFTLDERNAPVISEICRRLDGIALAIELAAARVTMLEVDEICARLHDRFRLLTGSTRGLPRHQTLHATLQWSHDLLPPQEQRLLRELAVFAGGCTLAAATDVAGHGADEYAVLELLTHLHNKSLLVVDPDSSAEPRYRMLETVRQYAQERLNDAGDGDAIRDRHLRYFVALSEEAAQKIHGPQLGMWMARLGLDQENLLAAHAWCRHAREGRQAGLRLVASLWRYWITSAQLERGHELAISALAQTGEEAEPLVLSRALWATGQIALNVGLYDETLSYAEQSLAHARALEDAEQSAAGLGLLGVGYHATGQHSRALAHYEQACEFARTLGTHFRLSGVLNGLAEVHRSLGNFVAAEAYYEESIGVARDLQDSRDTAVVSCNLARLLIAAGKTERSRSLLLASLTSSVAVGLKGIAEHLLEVTAGLAVTLGDNESAARFNGAALTCMHEAGARREPVDEAFIDPLIERARIAMGSVAFAEAEAAGRALPYDAAIAEVRQFLEGSASA